jgi:hypothetical protein
MNEWRKGYGERTLFQMGDEYFCFKSEDDFEERIIMLTDDYRDENGDFIPPEVLAPEPEEDRLSW